MPLFLLAFNAEVPHYHAVDIPTEFDWDDTKAEINRDRHGVLFPFAVRIFSDPGVIIVRTIREQDGEDRYKAIGIIDNRMYAVVFVMRSAICRLISARRTNAKEDRAYDNR